MLLDNREDSGKRYNAKIVVGYDLGDLFSQVSYYAFGDEEPCTVSPVTGTEQYNIPTVLCKRTGVSQWYYGKEALKNQGEQGILVDHLLEKALVGEEVLVENDTFDPVALLTLFIKRSLAMLNMQVSLSRAEVFMFTVDELTPRMVEVLSKVVSGLQLKCPQICFQSHVESFYYYMLHQQQELWKREVFVFEFNDYMKTLHFQCNRHTTPKVVFIERQGYSDFTRATWEEDESLRVLQQQKLDEDFGDLCIGSLQNTDVSTIFLIGEGFKEGWTKESLKILCHNRRVFQGNNLYSKGACYAAMDKEKPSEVTREYVYLGEDKLKANIGMKALRRGEESYLAILDAGVNWYEAKADFDLIMESGNVLCFTITPLTGENIIDRTITLDGLPERPRCTTRLRIHAEMTDIHTLSLEITDLGFGELFKSSGRAWIHTLQV